MNQAEWIIYHVTTLAKNRNIFLFYFFVSRASFFFFFCDYFLTHHVMLARYIFIQLSKDGKM